MSSLFFPPAVLIAGAVLIWLVRRIPATRWPGWPLVRRALPLAAVSIALLTLWTLNRPASPVRSLFVFPAALGTELSLKVQLDGWSRLFGLMLLWPALFAGLLAWFEGSHGAIAEPPRWRGWLFCLAAAQFALLAADWLTLIAGLLAFDLCYLAAFPSQQKRGWIFGANSLGSLVILAAALLLTVDGTNPALKVGIPLPAKIALPMVGMAIIRLAPYPLHFWLSDASTREVPAWQWPVQLASPLLGLYLLARLASPLGGAVPARGLLLGIGLAGCLVAALLAWLAARDRPRSALPLVVLFQLNLALLSWTIAPEPALALWIGLALLLAAAALALHRDWIEGAGEEALSWRDRVPGGVAAAALAGLPLTVGFFARVPLYGALLDAQQIVGLIFLLTAEGLQAAALLRLWDGFRNGSGAKVPQAAPASWARWAGGLLLVAPLFLLGMFPVSASQWAAAERLLLLSPWQDLWGGSMGLWAALLIPWALGYGIYRSDPRWPPEQDFSEEQLTALLTLGWLHRAIEHFLGQIRQALWSIGRLLDGEGYLAWVALSLLLVAALFLAI